MALPLGLLALARRFTGPTEPGPTEAPRTVYPVSRRAQMVDAFTIDLDDRLALQDALYQESITTYEAALTAEAERLGMATSGVYLKNAEELAWLTARAVFASSSIERTYNARLVNQIEQLLKDNPKANRDRLTSKLEKWWSGRSAAQGTAVAQTETAIVAQRALEQLYDRNNIEGECFFGGSEECQECQDIASENPHTIEDMQTIGIPHVNCGDQWEIIAGATPTDDQAWLGE